VGTRPARFFLSGFLALERRARGDFGRGAKGEHGQVSHNIAPGTKVFQPTSLSGLFVLFFSTPNSARDGASKGPDLAPDGGLGPGTWGTRAAATSSRLLHRPFDSPDRPRGGKKPMHGADQRSPGGGNGALLEALAGAKQAISYLLLSWAFPGEIGGGAGTNDSFFGGPIPLFRSAETLLCFSGDTGQPMRAITRFSNPLGGWGIRGISKSLEVW